MGIALATALLTFSTPEPGPRASADEFREALDRRNQAWQDVEVRFELRRDPTDRFVAAYRKDTGTDRPAKEIRSQFTVRRRGTYRSAPDGRLQLATTDHGGDWTTTALTVVGNDLRDEYPYRKGVGEDGLDAGTLVFDEGLAEHIAGSMSWPRAFGLPIGTGSQPYHVLDSEMPDDRGETTTSLAAQGTRRVARESAAHGGRLQHEWVFADADAALPSEYRERFRTDGDWTLMEEVVVSGDLSGGIPTADPIVLEGSEWNTDGDKSFTWTVELTEVRKPSSWSRQDFEPDVEQGANVIDARTGEYSVYGGKPGPDLLERLAAHADRSSRQVEDAQAQLAADPARPARLSTWTRHLPTLLIGFGILLCLTAVGYRIKRH